MGTPPFCQQTGLRFPSRFYDTLLMTVLTIHAQLHDPPGGAYAQAGLVNLTARFRIPFNPEDHLPRPLPRPPPPAPPSGQAPPHAIPARLPLVALAAGPITVPLYAAVWRAP